MVKVGNLFVMLDAGLRPKPYRNTPLFARAYEFTGGWRKVKGVILSHAHLDHAGAIPKVAAEAPHAEIFAPVGSLSLLKIQVKNVLAARARNGKKFAEDYEEVKYQVELVDRCLERVREVPFFSPTKIPCTNVYFEFWPAGHLLGSASVFLQTREGTLLYTGDVCTTKLASVGPLQYPNRMVDHVVSESTRLSGYGRDSRERSPAVGGNDRAAFLKKVEEVTSRGGTAVVPCFALGKAQEVLATLARWNAGRSHEVPVFTDGLVTPITDAYRLFYTSKSGNVGRSPSIFDGIRRARPLPRDIDEYARSVPEYAGAVIVASSGRLVDGSKSAYWVHGLADYPECAVLFTSGSEGKDEEWPGRVCRRLLEEKKARLNGEEVQVQCEVAWFDLSTHAPAEGLLDLLAGLKPSEVLFVHGYASPNDVAAFQTDLERATRKVIDCRKARNLEDYSLKSGSD